MKITRNLLLIVLIGSARAAMADEASGGTGGVDRDLARAESLFRRVNGKEKSESSPIQCSVPSSISERYANIARIAPRNAALFTTLDEANILNLQCRAYASSQPTECDSLDFRPLPFDGGATTFAKRCYKEYLEMKWVHALVARDPTSVDYCRADLLNPEAPNNPKIPPSLLGKFCQEIHEGIFDQEKLCARLNSEYPKLQIRSCVRMFKNFTGDAEACGSEKDDSDRADCFAFAYFNKAHKSGNLDDCRASGLCRVMSGSRGSACDVYAGKADDAYCAATELAELISRIDKALDKLKSRDLSAYKSRSKRFAAFRGPFLEGGVGGRPVAP